VVGLDSPAFQKPFKQLLLRVHPDRVAQHPHALRANETSFKVLCNYLDELRGDGGSPAGQYNLDFYVESRVDQPAWQDLTVNESQLGASAKIIQDPRYWQPGQERLEQHLAPKVRNSCVHQSAHRPTRGLTAPGRCYTPRQYVRPSFRCTCVASACR
jgi:Domain of unknown function (DUF4460)